MKKKQPETDAEIDEYLAPLMEMHDDESIRIARYLALKMSTLQAGIEMLHQQVAALAAALETCGVRIPRDP